MQPIRMIYKNLPEVITIPDELKNKKAEIIIWPLEEVHEHLSQKRPYGLAKDDFYVPDSFFEELPNETLEG